MLKIHVPVLLTPSPLKPSCLSVQSASKRKYITFAFDQIITLMDLDIGENYILNFVGFYYFFGKSRTDKGLLISLV